MQNNSDDDATLVDIAQDELEIHSGDHEFTLAPHSPASTHASDLWDELPSVPDNEQLRIVIHEMLNTLGQSKFGFMDVLQGIFYGNEALQADQRIKSCRAEVFQSPHLHA